MTEQKEKTGMLIWRMSSEKLDADTTGKQRGNSKVLHCRTRFMGDS